MKTEKIGVYLGLARTQLKASKPKSDAVKNRIADMVVDTKWHGDIEGTRTTLYGLLEDLGKLKGVPHGTAPIGKKLTQSTTLVLLPGVQEAIDYVEKALRCLG